MYAYICSSVCVYINWTERTLFVRSFSVCVSCTRTGPILSQFSHGSYHFWSSKRHQKNVRRCHITFKEHHRHHRYHSIFPFTFYLQSESSINRSMQLFTPLPRNGNFMTVLLFINLRWKQHKKCRASAWDDFFYNTKFTLYFFWLNEILRVFKCRVLCMVYVYVCVVRNAWLYTIALRAGKEIITTESYTSCLNARLPFTCPTQLSYWQLHR